MNMLQRDLHSNHKRASHLQYSQRQLEAHTSHATRAGPWLDTQEHHLQRKSQFSGGNIHRRFPDNQTLLSFGTVRTTMETGAFM